MRRAITPLPYTSSWRGTFLCIGRTFEFTLISVSELWILLAESRLQWGVDFHLLTIISGPIKTGGKAECSRIVYESFSYSE
jgi:hypothetical protein